MILDSLRNWAFYCGADSRLKRALEYLAAADLNTLEPGRYEIEGAEIFMKVTEGELKREEEASLEVHDKYIDVQVLIAGEVETMGWRERRECRVPRGPFDAEEELAEEKPRTVPPRFIMAASKLRRVRVLGS